MEGSVRNILNPKLCILRNFPRHMLRAWRSKLMDRLHQIRLPESGWAAKWNWSGPVSAIVGFDVSSKQWVLWSIIKGRILSDGVLHTSADDVSNQNHREGRYNTRENNRVIYIAKFGRCQLHVNEEILMFACLSLRRPWWWAGQL